jgi:hypothetical protein
LARRRFSVELGEEEYKIKAVKNGEKRPLSRGLSPSTGNRGFFKALLLRTFYQVGSIDTDGFLRRKFSGAAKHE